MALIVRRTFYGKSGTADALVNHLKEGHQTMQSIGIELKTRILSDHNVGRSDRVIQEWEVESLGDMDAMLEQVVSDPKMAKTFQKWESKLHDMIHYAEGDMLDVR